MASDTDPAISEINNVKDYGWVSASGPQSCEYIAPQILTIAKALEVRRIADLGSGNGSLCSMLNQEGFDVVGVEYDAQGHELSVSTYPEIKFYNFGVQDDSSVLLQSEAHFDMVVSTEVIEHLFSPHLLPQYSRGILRQGGYLVISTPYHGYLKNLALSVLGKWDAHFTPLWHGGHIKFWSRKTLTALLLENGFLVESFCGVGRVPFLWKSMILVARKL